MTRHSSLQQKTAAIATAMLVASSANLARAQLAGRTETQEEPEEEKPAPARVVPPKLTRFVQAEYPAEAQANGIDGEVVLTLTIDETGHVTAADVKDPAGHGFDEAAVAAAKQFEFEPAKKNGQPTQAKILYRYRFELKRAEEHEQTAAARTGDLEGAIRVSNGGLLAGVPVVITGADGQEHRVVTDPRGRFSLSGLKPGSYRVRVSAEGFQAFSAGEEVVAGERTSVTYRLRPKLETEGIEMLIEGERPQREVTRRTLERREMERIPGTGGDALRSLQSLPGVARPPSILGLLIIRGSAPEDSRVFFDGTSIPQIYHFGGLSSVVPTEMLDRIDFYPGNFSARYGRATGGIVDAGMRTPDTRCLEYGKPTGKNGCYHGMAQVDLIDARLMASGPLGGGFSFVAGARRSHIDAWLAPILESGSGPTVTQAPVYYDYQAGVERKRPGERLAFRVFGADDRLRLIFTDPPQPGLGGGVSLGTSFIRGQMIAEERLDSAVDLHAMFAVGKDHQTFSAGNNLDFDIETYPVEMRNEFAFKIERGFKLNIGLDFRVVPVDVTVRAPSPPRPGERDSGPLVSRQPLVTKTTDTFFEPAWYAEGEIQPTRRLRIVPGFRVDYSTQTSSSDMSPRLNARYDVVQAEPGHGWQPRTTIKGGVGLFHQPPSPQETNQVFGTPGLSSERALHSSIGAEQELTKQIELSVEGFRKDLSRLVSRAPNTRGSYDYNNEGSGRVIGAEFLLKYKPDDRFFGWIAYTLSRSTRQDLPGGREYLFDYDQTHNLTMLGSLKLGAGWEAGARFRLISGSPYTPVKKQPGPSAVYAADGTEYLAINDETNSARLPLFHQLDVRVDKHWQFRDWQFSVYADVQNVYNNRAKEAVQYNYNYTEETYQLGLPILPSIGLRGEF